MHDITVPVRFPASHSRQQSLSELSPLVTAAMVLLHGGCGYRSLESDLSARLAHGLSEEVAVRESTVRSGWLLNLAPDRLDELLNLGQQKFVVIVHRPFFSIIVVPFVNRADERI